MGMGLELTELQEQLKQAHIRTFLAWERVCKVIDQPFNPHRREICQEYINAARTECELLEKYTREAMIIPELHLPFELYYLYYQGADRKKWKKICDAYVARKDNA